MISPSKTIFCDTSDIATDIAIKSITKLPNCIIVFGEHMSNDDSEQLPEVDDIIFSGPATIVKWSDGTKTVTKLREGDEYDPLFGIAACAVRKLTGNRGHAIDDFEPVLRSVIGSIESIDDIKLISEMCGVIYDSYDKWYGKLGPFDGDDPAKDDAPKTVVTEREREATRQAIRDLIDSGELPW